MAEILDQLRLAPATIVGNSMGSRWAVELALRAPRRVERLVLIGAPAGSAPRLPLPLLAMRWPLTRPLMRRVFRTADADKVRAFFGRVLVVHPERVSEELAVATAAGQRRNHASMLSFAERVIAYTRIHPSMLLADAWHQLEVPVHFIWGDADAFDLPASGERARAQLRAGGDLTVISDAGHLPWLDAPQAVADALETALGRTPRAPVERPHEPWTNARTPGM
jgi:pimeloyl-ACP methyl ester carboxylesterase